MKVKRISATVFGALLLLVQLVRFSQLPLPSYPEAVGFDIAWLALLALSIWLLRYGLRRHVPSAGRSASPDDPRRQSEETEAGHATKVLSKRKALLIAAVAICLGMLVFVVLDRNQVADPPGLWVLESYNADNGYVLRKDGGRYVAHCDAVIWTPTNALSNVNNKVSDSDCAIVLPFLHKVIPLKPDPASPDIIYFEARGLGAKWSYDFKIIEAK